MDTKIQRFDRYHGLGYDGLDTRIDGLDTRYHGLVIDKSTSSQTICQTNKPSNHYAQYASYHGYDGLSIPFVYRRKMGRVYKRHHSLAIYNKPYIRDMGICGYRGLMV